MIFNGKVIVYSTCRHCDTLMQVISPDDTVHPTCIPQPTKVETLAQEWLAVVLDGDTQAESLIASEMAKHERPPQLHRAATWYARWGWEVFPLRSVGAPCDGGEKCAPLCQCPKKPHRYSRGFKDATTDLRRINAWWNANAHNNIGLATGKLFDVIDLDPPEGVASFMKLLDQQRIPEIHGVAVTASGGMHCYIEPTGKGCETGFMPGLDFRAIGGYCVAAPSTLGPYGRSWSWLVTPSPRIKK